jgi:P-type E1-E2 ATPase
MVGGAESPTTPLRRKRTPFAKWLTIVILAVAAGVCAFAALARGYGIEHASMTAVGVAVAAIPEGLPAVMTITLAIGVREWPSATLSSASCPRSKRSAPCRRSAPTRLTLNQMTASAVVTASGAF